MKKIITASLTIATVAMAVYMSSCKSKQTTQVTSVCKGENPTYTADIKTIIDANCASTCHSERKKADGIDLSSYENVKMEAEKKRFIGSMKHEAGFDPMPKKHDKLDEATLQKISCWVENGMVK